MLQWVDDGQQSVYGDDHDDEAGEIETERPEKCCHLAGQGRRLPEHTAGPAYLHQKCK